MKTVTMCQVRHDLAEQGLLAPTREGVDIHPNQKIPWLVLEQVEDCEDEFNLIISGHDETVYHAVSIDFDFFEVPVGENSPLTVTLDAHEWEKIISALFRDGKLITATMVIKKSFGFTTREAMAYYKSLPAYREYKVLWSNPTE